MDAVTGVDVCMVGWPTLTAHNNYFRLSQSQLCCFGVRLIHLKSFLIPGYCTIQSKSETAQLFRRSTGFANMAVFELISSEIGLTPKRLCCFGVRLDLLFECVCKWNVFTHQLGSGIGSAGRIRSLAALL